MLVMSRPASVHGTDGPPVIRLDSLSGAGGNDRLDGDDEAFGESLVKTRVVVVGHARGLVNRAADAVAAQLAHHRKPAAPRFLFDCAPDIENAIAGAR